MYPKYPKFVQSRERRLSRSRGTQSEIRQRECHPNPELIRRAAVAAQNRPPACPEWVYRRWFGVRVFRTDLSTLRGCHRSLAEPATPEHVQPSRRGTPERAERVEQYRTMKTHRAVRSSDVRRATNHRGRCGAARSSTCCSAPRQRLSRRGPRRRGNWSPRSTSVKADWNRTPLAAASPVCLVR